MLKLHPAGFSRAERGIEHVLENLPVDSDFQVIEHSGLTDAQLETLKGLADWKYLFPPRYPNNGRTMYGGFAPNSMWQFDGIKLKGAGGIKREKGIWKVSPPQPMSPYGVTVQYHLAVDAQLNFSVVAGSPKAINCLSAGGAKQEYRCQSALAAHSLGFAPLLYGEHRNGGKAVLDYNGTPIGAVATRFDLAYQPIVNFLEPMLLKVDDTVKLYALSDMRLFKEARTETDFAKVKIPYIRRLGRLKRKSALVAGVARHVGHYGNFLFNPSTDRILMSDTDSCVLYSDLHQNMWGPQFVRDMASDLFRILSDFPRLLFTDEILLGLKNYRIKPIHAFLEGVFGGLINQEILDDVCNEVHGTLVNFITGRREWLEEINRMLVSHFQNGGIGYAARLSRNTWHFTFLPLLQDALKACYYLSAISDLPAEFIPPPIRAEVFMRQSAIGVGLLMKQLEEASIEGKKKLGI
jgi:hypothetical protein